MANRNTDILFQLVRSMEKSEKRHFKLYIKRNSSGSDLKIVQLFDAIDKLKIYDEKLLLSRLKGIHKPQLANLKTHLYKQLLASLRLLKSAESIDLQLNEQFDHAHILYKKGLFLQSLRIIDRAKETAKANQKFNFLIQLIALEKRIEGLHITRSVPQKAEQLAEESRVVSSHIDIVAKLSNLSLLLYSWFIRYGHVRNEDDEARITAFMQENLPAHIEQNGFYEKLYLYQSYCWYAYIRQNFLQYYRYAQKWADLFSENTLMIRVETGHYIKALHNLLNAHFILRNGDGFDKVLNEFTKFAQSERVTRHDNFRVQAAMYISIARMNRHFMEGTFSEGQRLIPEVEKMLDENMVFIDRRHYLLLHYKIALLYFGNRSFEKCIDHLRLIIQESVDLATDLHCYSRLLHLLAHYELGNEMLMEPLIRSAYRFMSKMHNLTVVEKEIFNFLRSAYHIPVKKLQPEFVSFYERVRHLERNRRETRSFAYLDIISWIEAKIRNMEMAVVINEKYLSAKRRKTGVLHSKSNHFSTTSTEPIPS